MKAEDKRRVFLNRARRARGGVLEVRHVSMVREWALVRYQGRSAWVPLETASAFAMGRMLQQTPYTFRVTL